jgi:hypothetical protein
MIAQKPTWWLATFFALAVLALVPLTAYAQATTSTPAVEAAPPAATPVAPPVVPTSSATTAPLASAADGQAALGSYVKIDGRLFAGIYSTGHNGTYPNRTVTTPDAKLRFVFTPNQNISAVARFAIANATPSTLDLLYVDVNNWAGALPGQTIRVGKHLVDFGEEEWAADPEDGILITNSVSAIACFDSGLNFRGTLPATASNPVYYSLEVLNDTGNTTASQHPVATVGKLGVSPLPNLYISASYLTTGNITGASSVAVAGLGAPDGTTSSWSHQVEEVDLRYNYGPTGTKYDVSTVPTSKFQVAGALGSFTDEVNGGGKDRKGQYWYAEGLYNVTKKLYTAARYSDVGLNDGYLDKIAVSSESTAVAVNSYNRTGLGLGYRLSTLVHLKAEYTINNADGGATKPKLNQFAIGVATKF